MVYLESPLERIIWASRGSGEYVLITFLVLFKFRLDKNISFLDMQLGGQSYMTRYEQVN
jgi:hypothetical protein